jgi:hypothetical protein
MGNSLLWWALVFSSQLAGTRAQGIPAGLQESSSGGLNGKIIGLGNGYGGEAHGYSKVFDGLTDTWFDCFDTDGIDIKSDCWTGLELPAPSAIGAIRFFPRGNCPGCQTGGNPACVQLQKEHGKADQGACRMSGGKFQGAMASTGPWHDLATISTTSPVAEASWSSLSSTDSTPYTHVRYMSAPSGYCNVAEVEFYAPSVWGWTLVGGTLLVSAVYLFGGVVYGRKVGSTTAGLAAHPHYVRFVAAYGLVMDGVAFARGRGRSASRGGYRAVDDNAPSRADGGSSGGGSSAQKSAKKTKKMDKRSTKAPRGPVDAPRAIASPSAASTRASGQDPQPAAATARASKAGDGGRWVHVPN